MCCLAYCCCTFISWIAATTFVITLDLCQLLDSTANFFTRLSAFIWVTTERFWYTRYQKEITFSTQGSGHRSLVKYRDRLLSPLVIICPNQWVAKLGKMNKTSHGFSLEKNIFQAKSCQYVLVLLPCPLKMEYFFWFHDQLIFFHQTSIEINELQRND